MAELSINGRMMVKNYKDLGKYDEARRFGILFFKWREYRLNTEDKSPIIGGIEIRNNGLTEITGESIRFSMYFTKMLVNMGEDLSRSRRKTEAVLF